MTHTFKISFASDFDAGHDAVKRDISALGFEAARAKFNLDNPVGHKPSSSAAYYYAEGGMKALVAASRWAA